MESDPSDEERASPWPVLATLDPVTLLNELRSREQASRRAQQRLTALFDAVMAVTADLELADVLLRIVHAACELVDAKYGALG
ncbi:MAG TPA: histidine kinase, partial [Dermatophilaceae bacterium]